ncbi:MAG: hypothetical protein U0441_17720 [Polyangiaceae bacterium]
MLQARALLRWFAPVVLAVAPLLAGCTGDPASQSNDITDVQHTDVERQSIGNCWLYAEASWAESMHLQATGEKFDISQSYWTYWHWFQQIVDEQPDQLETGGFFSSAGEIILARGLMPEAKFVKEDSTSEMSTRQKTALDKINTELKTGKLKDYASRQNRALVRQVMDDAWQLTSTVKGQLTKAFGKDYTKTFDAGTAVGSSAVIAPKSFVVQYTERLSDPNKATVKKTTLDVAIDEWVEANYPTYGDTSKRNFQIRVQKALHDAQPVVISWNVDFNAMESYDPALQGSFNLTTLKKSGKPGHQGGHMTVLEDYEATLKDGTLLTAGVTLDPTKPEDKAKLDAALLPTTTVKFFRIKNSWGAFRDDRSSAPGMPGYHDLYMDYMNGPIAWCPDAAEPKTAASCTGKATPFESVVLPPGY